LGIDPQASSAKGFSGSPIVSATIRQIHPIFVGEVTSVDMRKRMSAEDTTLIEAGMDE
jgi:hypothetical protein